MAGQQLTAEQQRSSVCSQKPDSADQQSGGGWRMESGEREWKAAERPRDLSEDRLPLRATHISDSSPAYGRRQSGGVHSAKEVSGFAATSAANLLY